MAAPTDIAFSCTCGTLSGTLRGAHPRTGTHAVCFCDSCRASALYHNRPDPAPGPVHIFQTTPDRITIDSGMDQLAVMSFGDKNLLRWYAACCGTPMFNTARSAKFSFVGVLTDQLSDTAPLGPIVGRGFIPAKGGKVRHEGLPRLVWRMLSRVAVAGLSGTWKNTIFFDTETLKPSRPVQVLPKDTRAKLLQEASKNPRV